MRGVKFERIHTGNDWGLVLNAKSFPPPLPKTYSVEVEGRDGVVDLSESLTGTVKYQNRTVTFEFTATEGNYDARNRLFRKISGAIQGKKLKAIIDDDPEHYFYGRWTITNIENYNTYGTLKIEGDCEPWLYAIDEVNRICTVSSERKVLSCYNNGFRNINPTFEVSGDINISFDDISITGLTDGKYINTDILFVPGNNHVIIEGTGTVIITYQEAVL